MHEEKRKVNHRIVTMNIIGLVLSTIPIFMLAYWNLRAILSPFIPQMNRIGGWLGGLLIVLVGFSMVPSCLKYGEGSGEEVPVDDYVDEFTDSLCDFYKRCDMEWWLLVQREATCEDMARYFKDYFEELIDSVRAGRIRYDGKKAAGCLGSFDTEDCILIKLIDETKYCLDAFSGAVESSGACYNDEECKDGNYCNESSMNCPGICQAFKDTGEPCGSPEQCDQEIADCDYATDLCVDLGQAGDSCEWSSDCRKDLVCNRTTEPRVCTRPGSVGDACSSEEDCLNYLLCVSDSCAEPGGLGEACMIDLLTPEIRDRSCGPGLYCTADYLNGEEIGTCQAKKEAGTECLSFYECASGLLCIGLRYEPQTYRRIPGACGTPLKPGDACEQGTPEIECEPGLYCDETSGTCTHQPILGESCTGEVACYGYGVFCDGWQDGVCQPLRDAGESCEYDDDCWSRACSNGVCYPIPCTP